MASRQVDILIVGGGLIGASLLLALAKSSFRVLLVDAQPLQNKMISSLDARSLVLSLTSVAILKTLNVWPEILPQATPVHYIHVSQQNHLGKATLKGKDNQKPLGYVAELQDIQTALYQALYQQLPFTDQVLAPAKVVKLDRNQGIVSLQHADTEIQVQAKLIIAADGADSTIRTLSHLPVQDYDFKQDVIVSNIALKRPHFNWAYERFTPRGSIALLPLKEQKSCLVWALPQAEAQELLRFDNDAFLHALQKAFGYRLGRFLQLGRRVSYPALHRVMPCPTAWPLVFIGNAAHALHPIAAQGFNLGLRDIAVLAEVILAGGLNESMLKEYKKRRYSDQKTITAFTRNLVRLFGQHWLGAGFSRSLGLLAFDQFPTAKSVLSHYTQGFAGEADLICGISLNKKDKKNEKSSSSFSC